VENGHFPHFKVARGLNLKIHLNKVNNC